MKTQPLIAALAFSFLPLFGHAKPLSKIADLSAGTPALMHSKLGPESYVRVETQKLTKARVLWVNWDYLREKSFDVTNHVITPAIEKAILDAFAYGVRAPNEPEDAFSASETKTFYADRYGGDGLAGNMGSGRAASAGEIQIKGIGKTELVTTIGAGHSNGTADLAESFREAVYGEVANSLPFAANRVIAILDRGTTTTFENGHVQSNAMIVREDPLRPAHYMRNYYGRGPLMDSEEARTQQALSYLKKAFPVPADAANRPETEQIRAGILGYADHVAEQYAAAFARKIYHGATSTSNIEASGRFIDYGTITTVPDYGPLRIISINDPVGVTNEFRDILMLEFLQNLRNELRPELAARLPSDPEMTDRFTATYDQSLNREFLRLTGLLEAEVRRLEHRPEAKRLTSILLKVATVGSREVLDPQSTQQLTTYNVNRVLVKLAMTLSLDPQRLDAAIASEIPNDAGLRHELVSSYATALSLANTRAGIVALAQERNAIRDETHRWNLYGQSNEATEQYIATKDPSVVGKRIDGIILRSRLPQKTVFACRDVFGE